VNRLLKLLSLPGSAAVLKLACAPAIRDVVSAVGALGAKIGLSTAPHVQELWRSYSSLGDEATRRAFLRTLRAVIDAGGQAVSATNRLHLAGEMPTLIIWGDADPIIPVSHAHAAHEAIAGSQLEIFPGVGHYPHCEDPARFVEVLSDFVESTVAARIKISRRHVVRPAAA
jgi:pimeloyl-ACP methyl ester carboxylesterase